MSQIIPINLAFEDDLSGEVLRKLLLGSGRSYQIGYCFPSRGYGYIKKNICGFNKAAKGMPYLVLTDLDNSECAPAKILKWLPHTRHPNQLGSPKRFLIELAKRSRRRTIREDLVPRRGSTAKQGSAYNGRLISFVRAHWDHSAAKENSPSLERTVRALEIFVAFWDE